LVNSIESKFPWGLAFAFNTVRENVRFFMAQVKKGEGAWLWLTW
jgi:hypothetical protein